LEEVGYQLQRFSDFEFKFRRPSSRIPTFSDDPYSLETEALVELHLAFWDHKKNYVPLDEPSSRLDRRVVHESQGLRFPVLNDEDAFILQVIHVFQHTLECWMKLSWLLEIGYFMKARSLDGQLWDRIENRVRDVPGLTEFAAVVMGLAEIVFGAPMPSIGTKWTQSLRPPVKSWLEHYAWTWVIEDHPYHSASVFSAAKLALFLHREFISDPQLQKEMTKRRLFPWKQPDRIAIPVGRTASSYLKAGRLQSRFMLKRLFFHIGSDARYLWELPRWRQLSGTVGIASVGQM
jgi:hypothetical protein